MAPNSDHRIRRARAADLDALAQLETLCFEPHRRVPRRSLRRSLASRVQRAWVLERRRQLIGFLIVWAFTHTWRIFDVAVHPDHQGRGHGARLVEFAERQAARAGATRIVLEAAAADQRLLRFYESRGYRRERRLPGFYRGRDAWRLAKDL